MNMNSLWCANKLIVSAVLLHNIMLPEDVMCDLDEESSESASLTADRSARIKLIVQNLSFRIRVNVDKTLCS